MSRGMRSLCIVGLLAALAVGMTGSAWAQAAPSTAPATVAVPEKKADTPDWMRWGGDIRLREEIVDNLPFGPFTGTYADYIRLRVRLWTEIDLDSDVTMRLRLCDESRYYLDPNMDNRTPVSKYQFPDEVVVDNLFFDIKNLFDGTVNIRLGRQDMFTYGNGRLIMDASPLDGSRTYFLDALKVSYKPCRDTTIDFLGIINFTNNPLAINSRERRLIEGDDYGAGVYMRNASLVKDMPFEFYYFWKHEDEFLNSTAAVTNRDGTVNRAKYYSWLTIDGRKVTTPATETHTVGFRVMPDFGDGLSGNAEVAFQFGDAGDKSISAYGADASVTYKCPSIACKPTTTLGLYYLSGDDPATTDCEGWNPLWARWPQYSELYLYMAPYIARWTDLMMPYVDFSVMVSDRVKLTATVAHMSAPEDEIDKGAAGTGSVRGLRRVVRADFNFGEKLLCDRDKLVGHLMIENMDLGSYYGTEKTALFGRWEFMYSF